MNWKENITLLIKTRHPYDTGLNRLSRALSHLPDDLSEIDKMSVCQLTLLTPELRSSDIQ